MMKGGVVFSIQQRSSTGDEIQPSLGQPDEGTSSSRSSPGKTVHTVGHSPRRSAKTCIARQSGLLSMLPSLLLTSPLFEHAHSLDWERVRDLKWVRHLKRVFDLRRDWDRPLERDSSVFVWVREWQVSVVLLDPPSASSPSLWSPEQFEAASSSILSPVKVSFFCPERELVKTGSNLSLAIGDEDAHGNAEPTQEPQKPLTLSELLKIQTPLTTQEEQPLQVEKSAGELIIRSA
ncbi:hypothetical protein MRX96_046109 [Rhipicephalus microplus]